MKQQVMLVQIDIVWESRAANFKKIRSLLDNHPPAPGSLVVLPEMFAVGFSMNVDNIHEGEQRPTESFLADTAKKYEAFVLGGLVTRTSDGFGRNEALVVAPDGSPLARYVKMHPFSYGGESDHYRPGNRIVTFKWHNFLAAPFICYDLRFPEIYRAATTKGAQMLVTIANFPGTRVKHWINLLVARAIENQAIVIGVNRCGSDPNLTYPGRSMLIDPTGEIVVDAGEKEGVVTTDVSLATVVDYRRQFPALQDMRPEFMKTM